MASAKPRLLVVRGRDRGRELEIAGVKASVGRGTDNDLVLSDLSVSRHHVTFYVDDREVRARDQGSGNGTLRNGAALEGETPLRDGDELEIGHTVVRLVYPVVTTFSHGLENAHGDAILADTRAGGYAAPLAEPVQIPTIRTRTSRRSTTAPLAVLAAALALVVVAWTLWPRRAETPPAPPPAPPPPVVIALPPPPPAPAPEPEPAPAPARTHRAHGSGSGVERTAATQYAARQFAEAASTLRIAADRDPAARERLAELARDYAAVGAGLARGAANARNNPTVALLAYEEALAADVRSGNGVFAAELRAGLSKVAPAAAAAFLDAGRYEQARAACDIAGDERVAAVRARLESVAGDLYAQARAQSGEPARALYRRILRVVPAASPWTRKALAALGD